MTLFNRHRNTVEPMMLADNRKSTLQAIHTDAVNKAVKDQKKNKVLDVVVYPYLHAGLEVSFHTLK